MRVIGATLIALAVIVPWGACAEYNSIPESGQANQEAASDKPQAESPPAPSAGQEAWEVFQFVNEWGEPASQGYRSPWVSPERPMDFPYQDIQGAIVTDCRAEPFVRLFFNSEPLLQGGELTPTGRGEYHTLLARIDGRDAEYRVVHAYNENFLAFLPGDRFLREIGEGSNNVAFLIPWYGEGNTRFTWPLAGYAEARDEACGQQ